MSSANSTSTPPDRIVLRLGLWTSAYVVTMAFAAFGSEFLWPGNTTLTFMAVAVNLVVGVVMIIANIRHLSALDEMMQRIQLEAMAVSLAVVLVGGLTYSLLDMTNLIPWDAEIGFLVMAMGLTYIVTFTVGLKRYK